MRIWCTVKGQVDQIFFQHIQKFIGPGFGQLQIDAGPFFFEICNDRRQNIRIKIMGSSDTQIAGFKRRQVLSLINI